MNDGCWVCGSLTNLRPHTEYGKDGRSFMLCEQHSSLPCIRCHKVHDNGVWVRSQARGEGFACPSCWSEFRYRTPEEIHRNRVRAAIIISVPLVIWAVVAFVKWCWIH